MSYHDSLTHHGSAAPGVGQAGAALVVLRRHVTVALKQEIRVSVLSRLIVSYHVLKCHKK